MALLLLIVSSILGLAGAAAAEPCSCTNGTSMTWTSIGATQGGSWTCAEPGPDDSFRVRNGCTVYVCDGVERCEISFAAENASQWRVDVGGQVVFRPGRVDLPSLGLLCNGNCAFEAAWRTWDETPPALLDDPWEATPWRVGRVVPCPGHDATAWTEDCGGGLTAPGQLPGDPNHVLFLYDPNDVEAATSVPALAESGEFLQFVRPNDADHADMSMENAHWYEITGRGSDASGSWILVNVLQTEQARPRDGQYPLARRRIKEITGPATAPAQSERTIAIQEPDVVTFDYEYAGACVYRADANEPGGVDPLPAVLSRTDDATPDTITAASADGWPWPIEPGQRLYLAHFCIRPGDPFAVVSPVVLGSASTAQDDTPLQFAGASQAIRGLLASQVYGIAIGGTGAVTIDHSAIWDASGGSEIGTVLALIGTNVSSVHIDYLNLVGGRMASSEERGAHAVGLWFPGASTAIELNDYSARYHGDDAFVLGDSAGYPNAILRRIHASFVGDNAETANLVDAGSSSSITVEGAVCKSCVSRDQTSVEIGIGDDLDDGFETTVTADGLVSLGHAGNLGGTAAFLGCWEGKWELSRCVLTNTTLIDGRGALAPIDRLENFVVRGATSLGGLLGVGDVDRMVWRNGVIAGSRGVAGAGGLIDSSTLSGAPKLGNLFENILFEDLEDQAQHPVQAFRFIGAPGSRQAQRFQRVTVAFSDAYRAAHPLGHWQNVWNLFSSSPGLWSDFYFDGVVVSGYHGGAGSEVALNVHPTTLDNSPELAGPCLFDNWKQNGSSANVNGQYDPADAPNAVFDVDLELFADFSPRPFGVADAAGCGIRAGAGGPGVHAKGWGHYIVGLEPEFRGAPGIDSDTDGLSDSDEQHLHGSDPHDPDTDGDGLSDGEEVLLHLTSPLLVDSDGDGFSDTAEVGAGTDPIDPLSHPEAVVPALRWQSLVLLAALLLCAERLIGRAAG